MNKKYLIGLDIGTTALKGIILDEQGNILSTTAVEYQLRTNGNDICELEAELYWLSTQKIIKELLIKSNITDKQIVALAFSSQGETLIPVDKNGGPLRNAIVWMDNRSAVEAKQIEKDFGNNKIYQITGQPEVIPMWPATKILWFKNHEPELFDRTHKFLLLEDYLIYKLTGKFFTEESLSSSTLYFDINKKEWWDEMLRYLGISSKLLPDILPSGKKVGTVTQKAAALTGLNESTFIVTGAYDHAAGAIGAGNIEQGIITETTGGAMAMCVTLDKPVIDKKLNLPCQCHAVKNKYFIQPYGQTAGMTLKWFKDNFSKEEIQQAANENKDVYDILTSLADNIPPGSEGLTILPHLMGTGSPEFDLNAKGIFAGISLNMTKGHFVRAIMESVACIIKANIESLEQMGYSIKEIRVLGGGAKSKLWNQIKADMLNIPTISMQIKEAPSLGAAILAGIGSGVFNDIYDGTRKTVKVDQIFKPQKINNAVYQQVYEKYKSLYKLNRSLWS